MHRIILARLNLYLMSTHRLVVEFFEAPLKLNSISPAMKYSKAMCKPPNMTQMMFPNVFIDFTSFLKVSIC